GCLIPGLCSRRPVFVFFFLDRNRINSAEPAVEIDVGAAPAAERPGSLHRLLAADRARLGMKIALGHAFHMVAGPRSARHHTALSQRARLGYPAPDSSVVTS